MGHSIFHPVSFPFLRSSSYKRLATYASYISQNLPGSNHKNLSSET